MNSTTTFNYHTKHEYLIYCTNTMASNIIECEIASNVSNAPFNLLPLYNTDDLTLAQWKQRQDPTNFERLHKGKKI